MSGTTSYFDIINLSLIAVNSFVLYKTYYADRKKDFENRLYELKLTAYTDLNKVCSDIQLQMDVNSSPFVEIYDFKLDQRDEWEKYCQSNILKMVNIGQQCLDDAERNYGLYISNEVLSKLREFCLLATRFVVESHHFDTSILIDKQDRIAQALYDLRDEMRRDMNFDVLDRSLQKRINEE